MIAIDHFAGTGYGVACQQLGIAEHGVEINEWARSSREAANMSTIGNDVLDEIDNPQFVPTHDLYLASPPCQPFTRAGVRSGFSQRPAIVRAIQHGGWEASRLRSTIRGFDDPRTGLVLAPLAHIAQHLPSRVALEQVRQALPIFEVMAEHMRLWGYDVWCGVLDATDYGVPQVRKRAILMASRVGPVSPPPRSKVVATVRGALGLDGYLGFPRRYDGLGESIKIGDTLYRRRDLRSTALPAQPVTEHVRSWNYYPTDGSEVRQLTLPEIARLQTYPSDFPMQGSRKQQCIQYGNAIPPLLARKIIEALL